MSKFFINGGKKLRGEVEIESAKNALLPILSACNLIDGKVVLHKVPAFSDVIAMLDVLKHLGAKVEWQDDSVTIDMTSPKRHDVPVELASKARASIYMLGPILARNKIAKVAYPGGCEIGLRPIDLHLSGMGALGAKVVEKNGYIYCNGANMKGGDVILNFPSVGATENIIMASVLTKGRTRIFNCAKEPEIVDLQNFLNACGAKVYNAGCGVIEIEGVDRLNGCEYQTISDRIITGTYMLACAMTGGEITLKNVDPSHNQALISKLLNSSCQIHIKNDIIKMKANGRAKAFGELETAVYPGFPTDLQAQAMALQCVSAGTSMIVENLFEARFKHIPELIKMGGDISFRDRVCVVRGKSKLYGADVFAHDLRGGASLVMAGLVAEGYTTISNIQLIDRGYFKLEHTLTALGADIKRIED